jgi:hypothetical protein
MTADQRFLTHRIDDKRHPGLYIPRIQLNESSGDQFMGDPNVHMKWEWVTKPCVVTTETHAHDFDEYFSFFGGDPDNILELNGEVELVLITADDKKETHTFTKATSVFLPKGLFHCPLIFPRVDKPFIFANYSYTSERSRIIYNPLNK